jgi:hypothetical protein
MWQNGRLNEYITPSERGRSGRHQGAIHNGGWAGMAAKHRSHNDFGLRFAVVDDNGSSGRGGTEDRHRAFEVGERTSMPGKW